MGGVTAIVASDFRRSLPLVPSSAKADELSYFMVKGCDVFVRCDNVLLSLTYISSHIKYTAKRVDRVSTDRFL